MEDKIITFQTFDNPNLAHIIRTRLEANDIPCFISDEHIIGMNPLYNPAIGGVKLKIFERDFDRCVAVLAEDENVISATTKAEEESGENEVSCANCSSTNVGFVNATKKRFGLLTMLVSFLFMIYPFHNRKVWHCYDCGEEFN